MSDEMRKSHRNKIEPRRPPIPRVLVIDDDEDVLGTLGILLKEAGYQPLLAADGHAGLRLLRAQSVDLVMTDVQLPKMDGREVIFEIRRHNAAIPIVAMSGKINGSATNSPLTAEKLGATRAIGKPFDFDDIVALIGELLPPRRGAKSRAS